MQGAIVSFFTVMTMGRKISLLKSQLRACGVQIDQAFRPKLVLLPDTWHFIPLLVKHFQPREVELTQFIIPLHETPCMGVRLFIEPFRHSGVGGGHRTLLHDFDHQVGRSIWEQQLSGEFLWCVIIKRRAIVSFECDSLLINVDFKILELAPVDAGTCIVEAK